MDAHALLSAAALSLNEYLAKQSVNSGSPPTGSASQEFRLLRGKLLCDDTTLCSYSATLAGPNGWYGTLILAVIKPESTSGT